jgi:hypothetical protein
MQPSEGWEAGLRAGHVVPDNVLLNPPPPSARARSRRNSMMAEPGTPIERSPMSTPRSRAATQLPCVDDAAGDVAPLATLLKLTAAPSTRMDDGSGEITP